MSTHFATLGRAYYGRGRVYLEKGDRGQAIENLSQAIHFDALPGHTFYYRGKPRLVALASLGERPRRFCNRLKEEGGYRLPVPERIRQRAGL